jgi:hypothetical protein
MNTRITLLFLCLFAASERIYAQVAIIEDGSPPDSSAIFQLESDSMGFIFPRLSMEQIEAIENPAEGLVVYCTNNTIKAPVFWNGEKWVDIGGKPFYKVGEKREGGIVFYVYPSGLRALILDTNSYAGSYWSCSWDQMVATHVEIGYGKVNSALLSYCNASPDKPVSICENLYWNGYSDYYLPSMNELFTAITFCSSNPNECVDQWSINYFEPQHFYWTSNQSSLSTGFAVRADGEAIQDGIYCYAFEGGPRIECGFNIRCIRDSYSIPPCEVPTYPDAGPNQLHIQGLSTYLQGNVPNHGTGSWTIEMGTGGSISDPADPATLFTGLQGHSYMLKWTITTECGYLDDNVSILFDCPSANAGPDQTGLTSNSTNLQGNTPYAGSGLWTIIQGNNGTIINPSNPLSSFSGSSGETYILRWTITSEFCTVSEDDVIISFI